MLYVIHMSANASWSGGTFGQETHLQMSMQKSHTDTQTHLVPSDQLPSEQ